MLTSFDVHNTILGVKPIFQVETQFVLREDDKKSTLGANLAWRLQQAQHLTWAGIITNLVEFIGHQITENDYVPSKVKVIEQFPRPQNVRSLQELLGKNNFYRRFKPSDATILCTL